MEQKTWFVYKRFKALQVVYAVIFYVTAAVKTHKTYILFSAANPGSIIAIVRQLPNNQSSI